MHQKPPKLLAPTAANWATGVRLKKIEEEDKEQRRPPPIQTRLSQKKSVLTSEATSGSSWHPKNETTPDRNGARNEPIARTAEKSVSSP